MCGVLLAPSSRGLSSVSETGGVIKTPSVTSKARDSSLGEGAKRRTVWGLGSQTDPPAFELSAGGFLCCYISLVCAF